MWPGQLESRQARTPKGEPRFAFVAFAAGCFCTGRITSAYLLQLTLLLMVEAFDV
jgi:hypothetical protein